MGNEKMSGQSWGTLEPAQLNRTELVMLSNSPTRLQISRSVIVSQSISIDNCEKNNIQKRRVLTKWPLGCSRFPLLLCRYQGQSLKSYMILLILFFGPACVYTASALWTITRLSSQSETLARQRRASDDSHIMQSNAILIFLGTNADHLSTKCVPKPGPPCALCTANFPFNIRPSMYVFGAQYNTQGSDVSSRRGRGGGCAWSRPLPVPHFSDAEELIIEAKSDENNRIELCSYQIICQNLVKEQRVSLGTPTKVEIYSTVLTLGSAQRPQECFRDTSSSLISKWGGCAACLGRGWLNTGYDLLKKNTKKAARPSKKSSERQKLMIK